jgi:hypothetical protein
MSTSKIPGFTAECSLYKTARQFVPGRPRINPPNKGVIPQLRCAWSDDLSYGVCCQSYGVHIHCFEVWWL